MPTDPWGGLSGLGLSGLSPVIGRPSLAQAMFTPAPPPPDPFAAIPVTSDDALLQQLLAANRARQQQAQGQDGMSAGALAGFGQMGQRARGAGMTAPMMPGPGGFGGAGPF